MTDRTDGQLLGEFARARSESAFAELVRRHGEMVYNACLRVTGSAENAEDAAQAAFAILARKAGRVASRPDAGGWLHRVAVQTALDLRKSEARRRAREGEAGEMARRNSESPEAGWERVSGRVDRALARLSSSQREVVVGLYLRGRTRAEMAGTLGLPEGTVASRCRAGLEKLRRMLGRQGVSVGAAALGAMLAEHGAGAPLPASFSSLPSVCASFAAKGAAGAGGGKALLLAEGTMRAMTVVKIKIAAALVCAATVVGGGGIITVQRLGAAEAGKANGASPLAGLPGKEGAHVARIKALKPGEWLDLGSPAPDPKFGDGLGRAWGWKMPFAPDLGGAFIYGEGVHGFSMIRNGVRRYNDELFFYDVNGHRWICCDPGTDVENYKGIINPDGFEARPDGQVAPVADCAHTYGMNTYDADRGVFMTHSVPSTYWPKVIKGRKAFLEANKGKRNADRASPYMWSARTGKWERKRTKSVSPRSLRLHTMLYIPSIKKVFGHSFASRDPYFYDPATNDWEHPKSKGPKRAISYSELHCYDSKRDRVYLAGSSGARGLPRGASSLWAYEIKTGTWIKPEPKGSPCGGVPTYAITTAFMLYDTANDAVVMFSHKAGRDKSADMRGIYVYDPGKNQWTTAAKKLPAATERPCGHGFYHTGLGVHFFFAAGDSRGGGKMLVYRGAKP
ncbi:MAG: sigma-70 family RNA polymerase sigma factor [Planctomycetota bacterium]|jgi:RNA polymerase sigma factor (sigma-70 family)